MLVIQIVEVDKNDLLTTKTKIIYKTSLMEDFYTVF